MALDNAETSPTDSLPTSREKFQQSPEFVLLRPFCTAIVQRPSEQNLERFREAFNDVISQDEKHNTPAHLVEYVIFPFVIHLKRISQFKDKERIAIFTALSEVLSKCEIQCWEMFVEVFQRLHVAIGSKEDPTKVDTRVSETELTEVMVSIERLVKRSLSFNLERIARDQKMSLLAFSVVLMLQVAESNVHKKIRITALNVIENYATVCEKNEEASRQFFKFLPGIVSSLKPMLTLKAGRVFQEIVLKGSEVLYRAVAVGVRFVQDKRLLEQPDKMLAFVFKELGEEFLLAEDPVYRQSLQALSTELLQVTNGKLPLVQEVLLNSVLLLRSYADSVQELVSTEASSSKMPIPSENVNEPSPASLVSYETIMEVTGQTLEQIQSGVESDLEISLRKLLSSLSFIRFNYMELRRFLPLLFSLATEVVHKCSSSVLQYEGALKNDKNLQLCKRVCVAGVRAASDLEDVLEEFNRQLSDFCGEMNTNFVGCLFTLNEFLLDCLNRKLMKKGCTDNDNLESDEDEDSPEFCPGPDELSELCCNYISVIDVTSSEVILSAIEAMAPRVQSVVDLRKACLLEGLGLMTELCPDYCMSSTLYLMVEYAGLQESSSLLSSTAVRALERLAQESGSLESFFHQNQSCILNELNVRMNNLSMHPNCPNALIFLAKYFDFRQTEFISLVDDALARSCDPLSGSYLQNVYVKVFYAFLASLYLFKTTNDLGNEDSKEMTSFLSHINSSKTTLLQKLLDYQKSVGIDLSSGADGGEETSAQSASNLDAPTDESNNDNLEDSNADKSLSSDLSTTLNICHRVLNFLPNSERAVRLVSMDCLIRGFWILRFEEDAILPLSHTVWQNIVPRFSENDYVVIRKSFDLLLALCNTSGTFLKKRILEEVFPKLSSLLLRLATASENVKNKDRQYYTYTQAFKLQLTMLEGMIGLCRAIDAQEQELDEVVRGCMLYLKPRQHKILKEAAMKLINALAEGPHRKSIWTKLVAAKLRKVPDNLPHPAFAPLPKSFQSPT